MFRDDDDRRAFLRGTGAALLSIDGRQVLGLFRTESTSVDVGMEVESMGPHVRCVASDIAGIAKDAPVSVGAENFRVKRVESHASGIDRLVLKR